MALVLFTGGARSGKSAAATRLALTRSNEGARVVVATFGAEDGGEMSDRIAQHRADRPSEFSTVEATHPKAWLAGIPAESLLLVDCLGTLLSLVMAAEWPNADSAAASFTDAPSDRLPDGYADRVTHALDAVVADIASRPGDTIVVTNEVGDGVVPMYATARLFRDLLGRANRSLLAAADSGYLVVGGRLIDLATLPTNARWPED